MAFFALHATPCLVAGLIRLCCAATCCTPAHRCCTLASPRNRSPSDHLAAGNARTSQDAFPPVPDNLNGLDRSLLGCEGYLVGSPEPDPPAPKSKLASVLGTTVSNASDPSLPMAGAARHRSNAAGQGQSGEPVVSVAISSPKHHGSKRSGPVTPRNGSARTKLAKLMHQRGFWPLVILLAVTSLWLLAPTMSSAATMHMRGLQPCIFVRFLGGLVSHILSFASPFGVTAQAERLLAQRTPLRVRLSPDGTHSQESADALEFSSAQGETRIVLADGKTRIWRAGSNSGQGRGRTRAEHDKHYPAERYRDSIAEPSTEATPGAHPKADVADPQDKHEAHEKHDSIPAQSASKAHLKPIRSNVFLMMFEGGGQSGAPSMYDRFRFTDKQNFATAGACCVPLIECLTSRCQTITLLSPCCLRVSVLFGANHARACHNGRGAVG